MFDTVYLLLAVALGGYNGGGNAVALGTFYDKSECAFAATTLEQISHGKTSARCLQIKKGYKP